MPTKYTINTDQRRGVCGLAVLGRGRRINKRTRLAAVALARRPPRRRRPPAEPRRGEPGGGAGPAAATARGFGHAGCGPRGPPAAGRGGLLRGARPGAARSSPHEKTLRAAWRAPRHPLQTVKNEKINTRPRARVLGSRGCHLSGAASAEAAVGVAGAARRALGRGEPAPSPPLLPSVIPREWSRAWRCRAPRPHITHGLMSW